jgi:hypothetical protein
MKKTIKGVQRKLGKCVMNKNRYAGYYRRLLEVLKFKWNDEEV